MTVTYERNIYSIEVNNHTCIKVISLQSYHLDTPPESIRLTAGTNEYSL